LEESVIRSGKRNVEIKRNQCNDALHFRHRASVLKVVAANFVADENAAGDAIKIPDFATLDGNTGRQLRLGDADSRASELRACYGLL